MKNTVSITGELLSDSKPTSDYQWPSAEPDFRGMTASEMVPSHREEILHECSTYRDFDADRFWVSHGSKPLLDQAIALLNHHAFQFNSRRRFRSSEAIRENVSKVLEGGTPYQLSFQFFLRHWKQTQAI